jgi:hypothetical protein
MVTSAWEPLYERWRHGGWYVVNAVHPDGWVYCVSRNYTDKKWRIAGYEERYGTFPSRDAAARRAKTLTGRAHDGR